MENTMKWFMVLVCAAVSLNAFAATNICTYDFNKQDASLSWIAFKTPKKVGVRAKFSDFKFEFTASRSLDDLLSSARISVNAKSVDSGDKARDVKIVSFFFQKMTNGTEIKGKVVQASGENVQVEFEMNGTKQKVDMLAKIDEKNSVMTLTGKIDVLKFGMESNLAAITKACYEKHEGVTWPDVELEFIAKIIKSCR